MATVENLDMVAATTPSSTKQIAYDNTQLSNTIRKLVRYQTDSNKKRKKQREKQISFTIWRFNKQEPPFVDAMSGTP